MTRDLPMPVGFGLTLDVSAKQLREDLWFGGSPPRVLRLTETGRRAWAELQHGRVASPARRGPGAPPDRRRARAPGAATGAATAT